MSVDDEIDRLYQLPPDEFTAARNALAKKEGGASRAAEIKGLQKPTLPVWAVNQLYWKKRKVFDRLMEAARRLRVEHGRQLSGKTAEVDQAESRHRDALKDASDEIRQILKSAGEHDTPATMQTVAETLQALPGREDHGRLAKPLKPLGFEALAGLVPRGGATIARLAEVKPAPAPARRDPSRNDAGAEQRAAAERKKQAQFKARDTAAAERALRQAHNDERTARADFARAEMTLARLQRERKDLQDRIDDVTSRRDQASVDLENKRRDAERAAAERDRLEQRLKQLRAT